ncbi:hypothetical protein D3C72_1845770 [compost metagenome]
MAASSAASTALAALGSTPDCSDRWATSVVLLKAVLMGFSAAVVATGLAAGAAAFFAGAAFLAGAAAFLATGAAFLAAGAAALTTFFAGAGVFFAVAMMLMFLRCSELLGARSDFREGRPILGAMPRTAYSRSPTR